LAAPSPPALARQFRELSAPELGVLTSCHALPQMAAAFFPVLVSPLLFAIWISPFFWFCAMPLSRGISLISVSVWACGGALILAKRWTRASPAVSAVALPPPLPGQIFSSTLLCADAGIPVRLAIRYHRYLILLLPALPWGLALAIFFLSEKGLFSPATPGLPILRGESRLLPFQGLQKLDVFFLICLSTFLLQGSEISLVLGTANPRFARMHRAGFFLRHRLAHGGDFQRLRQRRAQLRAKCESAPLRRSVTERETRSTESLKKVKGLQS
jgi:hypothetical protein